MARFIVDGMLGRFTRWLRILGCDVKYFNNAPDEMLLTIAQTDNRVLLTRDQELYRRARFYGVKVVYIEGKTHHERLVDVAKQYPIPLAVETALSRCPLCGTKLVPIEKAQIQGQVPKGTFQRYSEFWCCTGCGKIYWQGSHWERIKETYKKAKQLLEETVET